MKKSLSHLFIGVLLLSFGLTGCGDDDETEKAVSIVGTWQALTEVDAGCNVADNDETITYNCPSFCYTLILREDGTFEYEHFEDGRVDGTGSGTYTATDQTITACATAGTDCSVINFSVTATQLVFVSEDEDDGCTNTMTLKRV